MLIDWFTVGAQVVNFVILMWLLKRFLYRPILDAIDAREQKIAAELADAAAKKSDAQRERDEFQRKNEAIERQRTALLNQATNDAEAERQRLLKDVREAADAFSAKRQQKLQDDAKNLNQDIGHRVQQEVYAIVRKVLSDLASTSLEERITDVFIQQLRTIDGTVKEGLIKSNRNSSDPLIVRSAFELPSIQRAAIQVAINEMLSADVTIRFETAPDLISGVELATNGQKISWSISDYLRSLEACVSDVVNGAAPSEPSTDSHVAATSVGKGST